MELLKHIWNSRPAPGEAVRMKAVRALALFFAFMVCCTIVSRAADALTVAEVSVGSPKRMSLSHTLEVEGLLEPADKTPVFAPDNVMVTSVAVAEGEAVKAGDLLFSFDTADIRRELAQRSLELTRLELELDVIEENADMKREKNRTILDRAFDDYDAETDSMTFKVKAARDAMNRARYDLRKFVRDQDTDEDGGTAYDALRDDYQDKKRLYEEAKMEEEQALIKAGRAIEDAVPEEYTREKELKQTEIEAKQMEIAALKKDLAAGGSVFSPAGGTVVTLTAAAGKRLSGEAAAYLTTGGVMFAAELTKEQKAEAARGGEVTLTMPDNSVIEGLKAELRPAAGKNDVYRMTAAVPEGEPGMAATAAMKRKTPVYQTCVPLSAVRGQGMNAYVLAVREAETTLGLEALVEKVPVTVEDSNETYAAVSGAIATEDLIVIEGVVLSDGGRIRPVREA